MHTIDQVSKSVSRTLPESQEPTSHIGRTEIRVKGKEVLVPSIQIDGSTVIANGKWLRIAAIQDEELVEDEIAIDLNSFVLGIKNTELKADIFTFVQHLPDTTPRYPYHLEWDNVAVIPITTYADWWEKRVEPSIRRAVRKSTKCGVVVKLVEFDDAFVEGIVRINNETPIRQGKSFWHYKKSFEEVKHENSTYSERNVFLGAFCENELVGYIRMTYAGTVAHIIQILTMVKHFDKRPTNALIAKAVEICEKRGVSHLVYCNYVYNDPNSSLTEFKRRNGFEKVLLPRYYIPLTTKGRVATRLGLHRGLVKCIPGPVLTRLLRARNIWYARRSKAIEVNL